MNKETIDSSDGGSIQEDIGHLLCENDCERLWVSDLSGQELCTQCEKDLLDEINVGCF